MIYPKNEMIEALFASAIDEETGEMLLTEEELQQKLAKIDLDFDTKIEALRNSYMADKLEEERISGEASALWKLQQESSKRAKAAGNRAERTKRFIAWLLNGEKYNKNGVKVSYTVRQNTVIDDGFVSWAKQNAPELLNEPTVRKEDVTKALKSGEVLEFARMEPKTYTNVR